MKIFNLDRHWASSLRRMLGAVALLMVGANAAHATCTIYTGSGAWNRPTTATLSGTYTVSPSMANGTVIAEFIAADIHGNPKTIECAPNQTDFVLHDFTTPPTTALSSYGSKIYETGVQGIGVQVTNSGGVNAIPTTPSPIGGVASGISYSAADPQYRVKFIKTGPVSSGTVDASVVPAAGYRLQSGPGNYIYYLTAVGLRIPS